jgi:hypothetical protein
MKYTIVLRLFFCLLLLNIPLFSSQCFIEQLPKDLVGHILYFTLLPTIIDNKNEKSYLSPEQVTFTEEYQSMLTRKEGPPLTGETSLFALKNIMLLNSGWNAYCNKAHNEGWFFNILKCYDNYLFLMPRWYENGDKIKLRHEFLIKDPKKRNLRKGIFKTMVAFVGRIADASRKLDHEIAQTLNLHHFIGWHTIFENTCFVSLKTFEKFINNGDYSDDPALENYIDFFSSRYSRYVKLDDYKNPEDKAKLEKYCILFNQPKDKIMLEVFQLFLIDHTDHFDFLDELYKKGARLKEPKPFLLTLLVHFYRESDFYNAYRTKFIKQLYSHDEKAEAKVLQLLVEQAFDPIKDQINPFDVNIIDDTQKNFLNKEILEYLNSSPFVIKKSLATQTMLFQLKAWDNSSSSLSNSFVKRCACLNYCANQTKLPKLSIAKKFNLNHYVEYHENIVKELKEELVKKCNINSLDELNNVNRLQLTDFPSCPHYDVDGTLILEEISPYLDSPTIFDKKIFFKEFPQKTCDILIKYYHSPEEIEKAASIEKDIDNLFASLNSRDFMQLNEEQKKFLNAFIAQDTTTIPRDHLNCFLWKLHLWDACINDFLPSKKHDLCSLISCIGYISHITQQTRDEVANKFNLLQYKKFNKDFFELLLLYTGCFNWVFTFHNKYDQEEVSKKIKELNVHIVDYNFTIAVKDLDIGGTYYDKFNTFSQKENVINFLDQDSSYISILPLATLCMPFVPLIDLLKKRGAEWNTNLSFSEVFDYIFYIDSIQFKVPLWSPVKVAQEHHEKGDLWASDILPYITEYFSKEEIEHVDPKKKRILGQILYHRTLHVDPKKKRILEQILYHRTLEEVPILFKNNNSKFSAIDLEHVNASVSSSNFIEKQSQIMTLESTIPISSVEKAKDNAEAEINQKGLVPSSIPHLEAHPIQSTDITHVPEKHIIPDQVNREIQTIEIQAQIESPQKKEEIEYVDPEKKKILEEILYHRTLEEVPIPDKNNNSKFSAIDLEHVNPSVSSSNFIEKQSQIVTSESTIPISPVEKAKDNAEAEINQEGLVPSLIPHLEAHPIQSTDITHVPEEHIIPDQVIPEIQTIEIQNQIKSPQKKEEENVPFSHSKHVLPQDNASLSNETINIQPIQSSFFSYFLTIPFNFLKTSFGYIKSFFSFFILIS